MLRKYVALCVCILLLGSLSVNAIEIQSYMVSPSLSFTGTTANCKVAVNGMGKPIAVTMQLWRGDEIISSWTKSGTSSVTISESCAVRGGSVYQLKVSGTVGNNAISGSTTGICP